MAGRDWREPGGTLTLLATLGNWIMDQSSILVSLDLNLPPAVPAVLTLLGMSVQRQLQEEIKTEVKIRNQTRDNKFRFLMAALTELVFSVSPLTGESGVCFFKILKAFKRV